MRLCRNLKSSTCGFEDNPIRGRMKLVHKGAYHRTGLRDKQNILGNKIVRVYCSSFMLFGVTLPNTLRQSHAHESAHLQSLFLYAGLCA